jgi:DNA-binding NarL/FixJ family response regulator
LTTVLIVDDHAGIRIALRDLFESSLGPIVCREAENGADALVKADEVRPDLIILDLCMPIMNGFEVAEILRDTLPAVPIFLLTAHYMESTARAALQVGIRAVFSKHQDLDALVTHARTIFTEEPRHLTIPI